MFRLPRLPRGVRLIDADGTAAQKFQAWWQSVVERIENAINRADGAQMAADQAANKADTAYEEASAAMLLAASLPPVPIADPEPLLIDRRTETEAPEIILPAPREDGAIATDYVDFGSLTAIDAERRLRWDETWRALVAGMYGGTPVKLGIDGVVLASNVTGVTINKGSPVQIDSVSGGLPTIKLADPTDGAEYMLGFAAQNITTGTSGLVLCNGVLDGIDASGSAYGETWAAGDFIYFLSTGLLTNVRPASPGIKMPQALVQSASSTTGSLLVRMSMFDTIDRLRDVSLASPLNRQALIFDYASSTWQNDYYVLDDIQDVDVGTPADGQVLIYDTGSGKYEAHTITGSTNVVVTNAPGSITIALTGLGTLAFENTGATGTFTTVDGKTVTVTNGIITAIV